MLKKPASTPAAGSWLVRLLALALLLLLSKDTQAFQQALEKSQSHEAGRPLLLIKDWVRSGSKTTTETPALRLMLFPKDLGPQDLTTEAD